MLELFADLPRLKVPKHRRTYQITNFERPEGWKPREQLPELSNVVALDLETLDPGLAAGKGSSWYKHDEGFVTGIGSSVLHLGCVSLGLMKDRVAPAATFVLMLRLHMLTFGRSALRPRRATRACLHSKRLRTNLEGVNDGTIAESQAHSSTSKYHVIMI